MAAYSELSVLIVDDDEDDTFLTSRMLEAVGFNRPFVTADSVARATAMLADGAQFDVVFLDVRMPQADGFELLRWIRNQPCFDELKVIMLTSSDDPIDVGRARQLRANGYLLKRESPEKCAAILGQVLFHDASEKYAARRDEASRTIPR